MWDQICANAAPSTMATAPSQLSPDDRDVEEVRVLGIISPNPFDSPELTTDQCETGVDDDDNDGSLRFSTAEESDPEKAAAVTANKDGHARRRGRQWRSRVEKALAKMTTELAALREQLEVRNMQRRRSTARAAAMWTLWAVWLAAKHLLIEAVFWGLVFVWMRRRGDQRAEEALRMVAKFVRDGLRDKGLGRR